jgi:hypothetical protein
MRGKGAAAFIVNTAAPVFTSMLPALSEIEMGAETWWSRLSPGENQQAQRSERQSVRQPATI